jgi:hypothetical protein
MLDRIDGKINDMIIRRNFHYNSFRQMNILIKVSTKRTMYFIPPNAVSAIITIKQLIKHNH